MDSLRLLGDVEGHPFHGNQWTAGYPHDGEISQAGLDKRFPTASGVVDGREIPDFDDEFGPDVPNMSSISASLTDYEILDGVREVKLSEFEYSGKPSFYSVTEEERVKGLAERIKQSGKITPLIVVVDADKRGPYVLEGGHRFDALKLIGAKSFPALVVVDTSELELVEGATQKSLHTARLLLLAARRAGTLRGLEFDEAKHPRDERGQFSEVEGAVIDRQVFHGGIKEHSAAVTYYTENKDMAQSYVDMSNERFGEGGALHEARITIKNPAPQDVIEREAVKLGIDNKWYTPASVFDASIHGEQEVRQLVHRLDQLGYDGATLVDIAYGKQIEDKAHIVFNVARKSRRLAARRETPLHAAADRMAPKLSVALRYAFALGRKALKPNPLKNIDKAVEVVAAALRDVLPKVLLATYAAGGEVGAKRLVLRTAGDVEGHPFHGNQWTSGFSDNGTLARPVDSIQNIKTAERGVVLHVTHFRDNPDATFTDSRHAYFHPAGEFDPSNLEGVKGVLIQGTLVLEHPKVVPYDESIDMTAAGVAALKAKGYDGAINEDGSEVIAFFPKSQLKIISRKNDPYLVGAELRTAKRDTTKPKLAFRFDATNEHAIDWADRHAAELITNISETTRDDINNAIAEALEGGGIDHAIDEILDAVGDQDRAELIAHHEVMTAVHEGQREAWDQATEAGLLTGDEDRMWIVTGDEKVCPICEALDGKRARLGESYEHEGEEYEGPPAHVRCRCTEGIEASRLASEFDEAKHPRDDSGRWTSVTSSPEFKSWFGSSKAVDEKGTPMVLYHGSRHRFDSFEDESVGRTTDAGYLGAGFYFGDRWHAGMYAGMSREAAQDSSDDKNWIGDPYIPVGGKSALYPVFLSLQNPLVLDEKRDPEFPRRTLDREKHIREALKLPTDATARDVTKAAVKAGYDGVIFQFENKGKGPFPLDKEWVVFKAEQIKSAIGNKGTFDPKSKLITNSLRASKGENN